jgi:S1-C subfamily serine protease
MKKAALYSGTSRNRSSTASQISTPPTASAIAVKSAVASTLTSASGVSADVAAAMASKSSWRRVLHRYDRPLLFAAGLVVALAFVQFANRGVTPPRALTQEDIDSAVMHTIENKTLPSRAAKAAEAVQRSVVRVKSYADDEEAKPGNASEPPSETASDTRMADPKRAARERGIGSGVVVVDTGIILTNLHVIAGAKRLTVTFSDGMESEATVVGTKPENDLAVLRAQKIPDDLPAASMGSSANLRPGDEVVAVGFPFGIGPSVSAGVVSGLGREFRSPEGQRVLTGLIQFDAAANPGNSGGPLVNMSGEVVGIVTAILNPSEARTFIGIGFATTMESAGGAVGIPPF